MTILTMSIKQAVDLYFAIEQDEKVVLIGFVLATFATHELYVLLQEEFFVFSLEMTIYGSFL